MTTVLIFKEEIKKKESEVVKLKRNRSREAMNSRVQNRENETMTSGQWELNRMAKNDGYIASSNTQKLLSLDQRSQMRIRNAEKRFQNFDRNNLGAQIETMSILSAGNTNDDSSSHSKYPTDRQ